MLSIQDGQENRARLHGSVKQPLRTPGAKNLKTPSRFNNENTVASLTTGLVKPAGARQALKTPTANPSRAVLGNKTTNAKAGAGFTGGKPTIKQSEKPRQAPTTQKRPKQRTLDAEIRGFNVKEDSGRGLEDPEPEYAPPPVEDLPYESDICPPGLTLHGLEDRNLLKGYYSYFHNPVDARGVSRKERQLEQEIEDLAEKAARVNDESLQSLGSALSQKPVSRTATLPIRPATASRGGSATGSNRPKTITSQQRTGQLAAARSRSVVTSRAPKAAPVRERTAPDRGRPSRPMSGLTPQLSSQSHRRINPPKPQLRDPVKSNVPRAGDSSERAVRPDAATSTACAQASSMSEEVEEEVPKTHFLSVFSTESDLDELPAQKGLDVFADEDDDDFVLHFDD